MSREVWQHGPLDVMGKQEILPEIKKYSHLHSSSWSWGNCILSQESLDKKQQYTLQRDSTSFLSFILS